MARHPAQPGPRTAVARLPPRPRVAQLLPPTRSVAVGVVLAALALVLYEGARETHVFAVRSIEVQGVSPRMAGRVETALAPLRGESLLKVKGDDVTGLATALPYVAGVTFDRAFPNTLRVRVEAERPLAVVRHGIEAWLVSRRGRIVTRIAQRTHRALPRIWLDRSVDVTLGVTLAAGGGGEEVAMLDALRGAKLARRIATVRNVGGQWVYVLRGGLELRVGTRADLPLKLEIARRILQQTPVFGYLDVSVPERPVAQDNPQLSTEGRDSRQQCC